MFNRMDMGDVRRQAPSCACCLRACTNQAARARAHSCYVQALFVEYLKGALYCCSILILLTRPMATKVMIGGQKPMTFPGRELAEEAIHTAAHTSPACVCVCACVCVNGTITCHLTPLFIKVRSQFVLPQVADCYYCYSCYSCYYCRGSCIEGMTPLTYLS
jgi:hypothetical protein